MDWDALVSAPVMKIMGDAIEYRPVGALAYSAVADTVFDEPYVEIFDEAGRPAGSTVRPAVGVRLDLLPAAPRQNDVVYIARANGKIVDRTFVVTDIQPDGLGSVLLALNFAQAGRAA